MQFTMNTEEQETKKKYVPQWDGKVKVTKRQVEVRTPHPKDDVFTTRREMEMVDIGYDPEREDIQNIIDLVRAEQAAGAFTYVNGQHWSESYLEMKASTLDMKSEEKVPEEELQPA